MTYAQEQFWRLVYWLAFWVQCKIVSLLTRWTARWYLCWRSPEWLGPWYQWAWALCFHSSGAAWAQGCAVIWLQDCLPEWLPACLSEWLTQWLVQFLSRRLGIWIVYWMLGGPASAIVDFLA